MNSSKLPPTLYQGKIRSLYPAGDSSLVMLTSDRISAFDVVFAEKVTDKGRLLNKISCAWCRSLENSGICERYDFSTHLISDQYRQFPEPYCYHPELEGVAVYVKKTRRIDFECIVRGYLAGSAWKEYQKYGTICGESLRPRLQAGAKLPRPLFTPSTKAEVGQHDMNVAYTIMEKELGKKLSARLQEISLAIYAFAAGKMAGCGILLADTKFEFGFYGDSLILIDEVLTPDSSRYWRSADYASGSIPPGFDKQHIRDYAESLGWNKKPPPPPLPPKILSKTIQSYTEIQKRVEAVL